MKKEASELQLLCRFVLLPKKSKVYAHIVCVVRVGKKKEKEKTKSGRHGIDRLPKGIRGGDENVAELMGKKKKERKRDEFGY